MGKTDFLLRAVEKRHRRVVAISFERRARWVRPRRGPESPFAPFREAGDGRVKCNMLCRRHHWLAVELGLEYVEDYFHQLGTTVDLRFDCSLGHVQILPRAVPAARPKQP